MRFLGGAVGATATALTLMAVLTGCGSQATQPTRTATVTVAPPPSSSAPAATPSPSSASGSAAPAPSTGAPTSAAPSTAPAASDGGRPRNQCTDLGVSVVVADGGGGAGSEEYQVLLTNTGGATCALRGTPGVSVVGRGSGVQLGKPADRIQTGVRTLTLQAGDTVAAPLRIVNIGTDGGPLEGCTVARGDGYRVYPPHSTKAFFVKDASAVACASGPVFMTVGPVVARTD